MRSVSDVVVLALPLLAAAGCDGPVTGPACVIGVWGTSPRRCDCGAPEDPTSDQCASETCEHRELYLFMDDGGFRWGNVHIDAAAFSAWQGQDPTTGQFTADESTIVLEYDFGAEMSFEYQCEDERLSRPLDVLFRLDDDLAEAVVDAAATGHWVNHAY